MNYGNLLCDQLITWSKLLR